MSTVPPARLSWPSALLSPVAAVVVAVLVLLIPAAPAQAHNQLISAAPEPDAVLASPPEQVVLRFVERLDPKFTTIVVTDARKQAVATAGPEVSGTTATVTFPQPLPDGTYTVAYRVVSLDGHPVQGAHRFTVGAPATAGTESAAASDVEPSPVVGATDDGSPAAAGATDDGSPVAGSTLVVGAGALVVLLGVVGAVLWRRRSVRR